MAKNLNVLISFICRSNDLSDGYVPGFIHYAFNDYGPSDAQDIVISNPDGYCYNMAVASYNHMLEEYDDYENVLFKAVITSQMNLLDGDTYVIENWGRGTFLVKYYSAYDEDEDDEEDIIYIDDKPYVDTLCREAYWFTNLKFTPNGTTEPKDVECKIWEAFEKYDEEYFEEY